MLAKPFYVKSRANPNLKGIALTHDLIPVKQNDASDPAFGALIGVAWIGEFSVDANGEEIITEESKKEVDEFPCISHYSPSDLIFLSIQNEVEEATEEEEESDDDDADDDSDDENEEESED